MSLCSNVWNWGTTIVLVEESKVVWTQENSKSLRADFFYIVSLHHYLSEYKSCTWPYRIKTLAEEWRPVWNSRVLLWFQRTFNVIGKCPTSKFSNYGSCAFSWKRNGKERWLFTIYSLTLFPRYKHVHVYTNLILILKKSSKSTDHIQNGNVCS